MNDGNNQARQETHTGEGSYVNFRIVDEANAYMHLYKKTYYEEVIKICKHNIDAIDYLQEQTLKISNNET